MPNRAPVAKTARKETTAGKAKTPRAAPAKGAGKAPPAQKPTVKKTAAKKAPTKNATVKKTAAKQAPTKASVAKATPSKGKAAPTKAAPKQAAKKPPTKAAAKKAAGRTQATPKEATTKAPAKPRQRAPSQPRNRRNIIPSSPGSRSEAVAKRIDELLAAGQRPVIVLFNDPATSLEPQARPEATFIDLTGLPIEAAENVRRLTSPAFLEMALVHVRKAIESGAQHVIVDDVATMAFYCGGGPTQAFTHSLVAGLQLNDTGCDLFVTESSDTHQLRQELPQWIN